VAPDCVFAPCTLAVILVDEKCTEEARALLDAVRLPEAIHPETMAVCWTAQAKVAFAEADLPAAFTVSGRRPARKIAAQG
jgi:hypothetical protein